MTVALANSNPVQDAGNNTAVTFSFPWKISASTDLIVGFITGAVYVQQTSGYTVAGIGNNGGGSITFAVAPPLGTTVDLRTSTPETQPTEFANLAPYLPENTTNAADRLTRMVQDLTRVAYTFGVHGPDDEVVPWTTLPTKAARANTLMGFDANGLPTIAVVPASVFTQQAFNVFLANAQYAGQPDSPPNALISRTSNYSGGTFGFVTPALEVHTQAGANDNNFEWAGVFILENFATNASPTGPQNVALQATGRMRAAAATWGGNFVAIDTTNTGSAGKATLEGTEIDLYFNGPDTALNRVGLNIVAGDGQFNQGLPAGLPGTARSAIQIGSDWSEVGTGARCQFLTGVVVYDTDPGGTSFQSAATNTWAFKVTGAPTVGYDVSGAPSTTIGLRLGLQQPISFDITSANQLFANGNGLNYTFNGALVAQIANTGQLNLGPTTNYSLALFTALQSLPAAITQGSASFQDVLAGTAASGGISVANSIAFATAVAHYYGLNIVSPTLLPGASISGICTGVQIGDITAGATNYGIQTTVSAGANKYNIFANGTAQNFFEGPMSFGVYTAGSISGTGYITITDNTGNTRRLLCG